MQLVVLLFCRLTLGFVDLRENTLFNSRVRTLLSNFGYIRRNKNASDKIRFSDFSLLLLVYTYKLQNACFNTYKTMNYFEVRVLTLRPVLNVELIMCRT